MVILFYSLKVKQTMKKWWAKRIYPTERFNLFTDILRTIWQIDLSGVFKLLKIWTLKPTFANIIRSLAALNTGYFRRLGWRLNSRLPCCNHGALTNCMGCRFTFLTSYNQFNLTSNTILTTNTKLNPYLTTIKQLLNESNIHLTFI